MDFCASSVYIFFSRWTKFETVLSEKGRVFLWLLRAKVLDYAALLKKKNAMEYAGYLCNFMRWNCRNLQKLRDLQKSAGTCKNCSLMKKRIKSDSPNTLFSLGYYLDVKTHFLLLPKISKHTTSQKVLGIFKFSSCFISDLNKHMAQTYKTLMSQTSSVALQKEYATTSVKMNK